MDGMVKVLRHGLDYQGSPVGPGNSQWEVCDECVIKLENVISKEIAKMGNRK